MTKYFRSGMNPCMFKFQVANQTKKTLPYQFMNPAQLEVDHNAAVTVYMSHVTMSCDTLLYL